MIWSNVPHLYFGNKYSGNFLLCICKLHDYGAKLNFVILLEPKLLGKLLRWINFVRPFKSVWSGIMSWILAASVVHGTKFEYAHYNGRHRQVIYSKYTGLQGVVTIGGKGIVNGTMIETGFTETTTPSADDGRRWWGRGYGRSAGSRRGVVIGWSGLRTHGL